MEKLWFALQKSRLFHSKSVAEIESLLKQISYNVQTYKENQIVFSDRQAAKTLGIVLSGAVAVKKKAPFREDYYCHNTH